MLVPPHSPRVVDRIRFWARAHEVTLTELGMVALGIKSRANARRKFDAQRNGKNPGRYWRPHEIDAIAVTLRLPETEIAELHRLAARELGWRV
jgi:hypothetical protein